MEWLFRNRDTGEITVAQAPNVALIIFMVAFAVDRIFSLEGTPRTAVAIVSTAAILFWAVDEILRGVNPFRRILGTVVLIVTVLSYMF